MALRRRCFGLLDSSSLVEALVVGIALGLSFRVLLFWL